VFKRLLRRLSSQRGFGLVELLMAMTILNVGILAIIAAFSSGSVAIRRASRVSTATALADSQMELYRGLVYGSIALDTGSVSGAAGALSTDYKCDSAVGSPTPACSTPSEITATCTTPLPNQCIASRSATGADQGRYRIDTFIQWDSSTSGGRPVKKVTVVVRDANSLQVYVREASTFDQSTG
jgi:type II secretory pathway pseudopilin PulG